MNKGAGEGLAEIWLEDGKKTTAFVKCFIDILCVSIGRKGNEKCKYNISQTI